jgi:hypothetical protein
VFRTQIIIAIGVIALAMKLKAQTAGLGDPSNWALFLHGSNLQIGYYCLNAGVNGCFTLMLGARCLPAYFKLGSHSMHSAGRIWWMGRQIGKAFGPSSDRRHIAVAAIMYVPIDPFLNQLPVN